MRLSPEMGVERPTGPATARQIAFIKRHDLLHDLDVSERTASELISNFINNLRRLSPTPKQEALLRQKGLWRQGMSRGQAFDAIENLFRVEHALTANAAMPVAPNHLANDKS